MKLIRTLLAGEGEGVCSGVGEGSRVCSGEIDGEGDSPSIGEGAGVDDSCAAVIATQARQESRVMIFKASAMCDLSIILPLHVRKDVIAPFAIAQKFLIEGMCDKLVVQAVESSKVIERALRGVFAGSAGFH